MGLTVDAWGGFSSQGKTELSFYEGTLDAPAYQDILQKKLLPAAQGWFQDEKEGMKKAIRQVWDEVDLSLLHNLIHSIPDRLRRIGKAKGGSIKAVN